MPARINRPVRDKIVRLHEEGLRFKEIAAELGVSPATVAKYCKGADAEVEVAASPAGALDANEVLRLRLLAATVTKGECPGCGEAMITLATMIEGRCLSCGGEWTRQKREQSRPTGGESRHDHPLSGREQSRRGRHGRGRYT